MSIFSVTLIRPPAYSRGLMGAQLVPFLGIAYIAAAARQAGYIVDIIDMCGEDIDHREIVWNKFVSYGMPFSRLGKRLNPSEVIGFTCMFSQDWVFHRELIRYLHKLSPRSIFVAGGEHISALPDYCLDDCPQLDICIIGEAEEIFVRLLDVIKKKEELSCVPSLVYRLPEEGVYGRSPRASRIKEIDKISLPAWDLTPMENYLSRGLNYHIRRGRTIPMLLTRGCIYQCTFCSSAYMWGRPWIARDPVLVVDEMEYYTNRYKANNFVFSDLTAVVTRYSIVNLCNEIIERKINITWQLPTLRTEVIDKALLGRMYQAGCRELDFAIESGSKKVLDSVDKRNDPKRTVSLIKDGLEVGMNLSVNIVLGLPEEGLREFLKTYGLVISLALIGLHELNVFPFVAYPGSKLFEELLKEKKIKLNDEYFFSLFGYADLARLHSWSEHFNPLMLGFLRLFLLVSFYSLMFISRPWRLLQLVINAVQGLPAMKLEGVLKRVLRDVRGYFLEKRVLCKQRYIN